MILKTIVVRTQFEGIHCYPDAPKDVEFLKHPHRHMFYVEAEIEVFHDDRELEFILVKRDLDKFLKGDLKSASCEMICRTVQQYLKRTYPLNGAQVSITGSNERYVNVSVFEDDENGARISEVL